jgi:hypothetical protein
MNTCLAPAPGADAIVCQHCGDHRHENGLGALLCARCDAP